MFLGRMTTCKRLSEKLLCWGNTSGNTSRLIASTFTLKQSFSGAASSHTVSPFGKFVFDGPGNVIVAPLSPQEFPNMDQCTVNCADDDNGWKVTAEGATCSVTSEYREQNACTSWNVALPIKYDVEVRSAGSVALSAMESSHVSVRARDDVILTAVKAGQVTVSTKTVVRVDKHLLGNVLLEAEKVDSSCARLQGQTVTVSAGSCCHLSDIYADSVRLRARSADLLVGAVHGDASVVAAGAGEVVIGAVDGSLQLEAAGAVRCHLSRLRAASRLSCGGQLRLTLAAGCGCRLQVRGPPPQLDPRLAAAVAGGGEWTLAGGGPLLELCSPLPAQLRLQEWAAAAAGWSSAPPQR